MIWLNLNRFVLIFIQYVLCVDFLRHISIHLLLILFLDVFLKLILNKFVCNFYIFIFSFDILVHIAKHRLVIQKRRHIFVFCDFFSWNRRYLRSLQFDIECTRLLRILKIRSNSTLSQSIRV